MPKPDSPSRLSRRQWAASLAILAPLPAASQTAKLAVTPSSDLDACRENLRRSQTAIRRARVPRETEPAFRFRA